MLCPAPPAQFEPKLVQHSETIVHHILVYACGNASALPTGISDCYGADPAFSLCSQVIVGWAVGGTVSPCDEGNRWPREHVWSGSGDGEWVEDGDKGGLGWRREDTGEPWVGVPCIYFPAILAAKPPSFHQSYQFPDDVGISIGTPLDPQWIRLEVHYSNFHNLPGKCLERLWKRPWMGLAESSRH